jgi:hypothetical protein
LYRWLFPTLRDSWRDFFLRAVAQFGALLEISP